MPTAVDVLVVGAGPAGAAAGLAARRRGLDVLVVDKASFPRDKTCGDGLTTAALRLIEQLGVDLRTLPGYMAVRETVLVGPDGRRVSLPLATDGDHAAVVPRVELDAAIVDTARRSGVEVRDGVAVSGIDMNGDGEAVTATTADGDSVRARFLIAADGHYSFVRRCLRQSAPPELGTWHAFRQYFRGVDDPRLYVLFEADLLPGYAWVFPLPEGRANVGFGVLRRPGMSGKELNARWRELLERPSAGPERCFQVRRVRVQQALGGIGVADAAAKLRRLVLGGRPEDAMAFGTGDPARNPRRVAGANGVAVTVGPGVRGHGSLLLYYSVRSAGVG